MASPCLLIDHIQVQWHPTEPFIASGGHDKNLVITNAATKERVVTVPQRAKVYCVQWASPAGEV